MRGGVGGWGMDLSLTRINPGSDHLGDSGSPVPDQEEEPQWRK